MSNDKNKQENPQGGNPENENLVPGSVGEVGSSRADAEDGVGNPPEQTPEPKKSEYTDFMKGLKIGDQIEFWPASAKEPKTITIDQDFLDLDLSDDICELHKYKKVD